MDGKSPWCNHGASAVGKAAATAVASATPAESSCAVVWFHAFWSFWHAVRLCAKAPGKKLYNKI